MKGIHKVIGTALGLGYSPVAPGTAGALGGLAVGAFIMHFSNQPNTLLLISILVFLGLGVYSSNQLEKEWGEDPSKVVIDEVVGMWISLLFLSRGWIPLILAFVFFRIYDIYKPFYIRKMENLKGGWGIMMDDVMAGVYANLSVQLILYLMTFFK